LAFHSGREADHSPPSGAEVKERVELYLYSPSTPSWRDAHLGGTQGQLLPLPFLVPPPPPPLPATPRCRGTFKLKGYILTY
jgi:hypothetical protein